MLRSIRNLLRPPIFDEPDKSVQAMSVHTILLSMILLTFLFIIYGIFFPLPDQLVIGIVAIILEVGLFVLVQLRRIRLASSFLTLILWSAIVVEVALYGGIRDTGFGAFAAVILIAGLTMGMWASIFIAAITLLAGGGLAIAENQGLLPSYASVSIISVFLSHSITLIAVALLLNLAIRSISIIARKTIEGEKVKEETNTLLEASQLDLQKQTFTLEQQNTTLQSVAAIARLTYQVKNEQDLLEQSAKLLVQQNKLEYVGLYVLDQVEESAILQISRSGDNSIPEEKGKRLNVVSSESASILLGAGTLLFRTGSRYYYVDPPKQLPLMKKSDVFPLISSEKLIGIMNIQNSLSQPQMVDNQMCQMLADQIAMSMANIRLLTQLQDQILEVNSLREGAVRTGWDQMRKVGRIGYTYDRIQVLPFNETIPPEIAEPLNAGKPFSYISTESPPRARLAAPIVLRNAIIGVIGYDSDNVEHEWQEDEKALLETVASRVSLALENSRLVAEAQQRAEQERMIGQVTAKMRETLDIETILKTAVKEMRQTFGLREAEVRMQVSEAVHSTEVSNE